MAGALLCANQSAQDIINRAVCNSEVPTTPGGLFPIPNPLVLTWTYHIVYSMLCSSGTACFSGQRLIRNAYIKCRTLVACVCSGGYHKPNDGTNYSTDDNGQYTITECKKWSSEQFLISVVLTIHVMQEKVYPQLALWRYLQWVRGSHATHWL